MTADITVIRVLASTAANTLEVELTQANVKFFKSFIKPLAILLRGSAVA
jgi:hypothetical protein